LTPDSKLWEKFPLQQASDWFSQRLIGATGDPALKSGLSTWAYNINKGMDTNTAFASLDGEALIVPQLGALDITTELGKLLVRAGEIAVIPRGLRYRVQLVNGIPSRGFISELYQGHYRLPELGIMGTSGAANVRDFQIPSAYFDGQIVEKDGYRIATTLENKWRIISRLNYKLFACEQDHTPFDIAGWHGTLYPYKYDLGKFDYLANVHFGHKDPSAHTVLTAQAYGKTPNTAVVDFIIFGKRHEAALDTHRLPWYHRNTMNEFSYAIWTGRPPTDESEIIGFPGVFSAGAVAAHGPSDEEYRALQEVEGMKPVLTMDGPLTIAMFETECPLYFTDWAMEMARENRAVEMRGIAE
jgi:homogentisate 1,2-dioxygenase